MTGKEFLFALINFLILAGALVFVAHKIKLRKKFASRQDKIAEELAGAETAKENARQIEVQITESRAEGELEREKILDEAKQTAEVKAQAILQDGREEADLVLQDVNTLEQQLRDEMHTEIQKDMVCQVAGLTGQTLQERAFDPYRDKLVARELQELAQILRAYPSDVLRLEKDAVLQVQVTSPEALNAAQRDTIKTLLQESFGGSLPAFLAAFTRRKKLTEAEIAAIEALIGQNRG